MMDRCTIDDASSPDHSTHTLPSQPHHTSPTAPFTLTHTFTHSITHSPTHPLLSSPRTNRMLTASSTTCSRTSPCRHPSCASTHPRPCSPHPTSTPTCTWRGPDRCSCPRSPPCSPLIWNERWSWRKIGTPCWRERGGRGGIGVVSIRIFTATVTGMIMGRGVGPRLPGVSRRRRPGEGWRCLICRTTRRSRRCRVSLWVYGC